MKSARAIYDHILSQLLGFYEETESRSIAFSLLDKIYGVSKEDIVSGKLIPIPANLDTLIKRIQNHEPIQYISGIADFFGLTFNVNDAVLIPRPETEELVDLILKENQHATPHILDIGTGSGCIAVSLAKNIPFAVMKATDISYEALKTARKNAERNQTKVELHQHDILLEDIPWNALDILVSNPPYVLNSEKKVMNLNVLDYEPHSALFVQDQDPLVFYFHLVRKGLGALKPGGKIYFEINENLGGEMYELMEKYFINVRIIQDIHGKDRIASAEKKLQ